MYARLEIRLVENYYKNQKVMQSSNGDAVLVQCLACCLEQWQYWNAGQPCVACGHEYGQYVKPYHELRAGVAQTAEQGFCKPQVAGATPATSSIRKISEL